MSHRALVIVLLCGRVFAPEASAQVLGPCPSPYEDQWECGSLAVPENRQATPGRMIGIEVKVRRATASAGQPPIFQFSGGPGAPTATGANPNMFAAQAATHDLVLIDQRGTGGSNGFTCELNLATEAARAFGQLYPMDQIAACYEAVARHSDPNRYTTGDFIDDVEAVRSWLGYPKIILSGGSYGTRSAMTYLERYPDRVAAAVLNGVIPPQDHAPLTYARSVHEALRRVFADCAQQRACDSAYPDLEKKFNHLMERLRRAPSHVTVRRPDGTSETVTMRSSDLGYAVRIILYNSNLIPRLPRWIHEAAETDDVSVFAQAHYDRAVRVLQIASLGLHFSVFCAEDVPFIEESDVAGAVRGTFFGDYFIEQYREGCRRWPVTRRDRRSPQDTASDVPVLLLSGRYDPVTPPAFAESMRRRFPNSKHIVQGNGGHGAGGRCVTRILNDFFATMDPSKLNDYCSSIQSAIFEVP